MYSVIRDSRLRYTKQCLFDALLAKLETRRISDMTVFEICEAAGVSRKTFYKYYPDAFSLLLAMQDDLFVGFEAALEEVEPNIFDIMPVLITFIDRHRVLMRASFANRGEGNFIDHVISYLYEVYQNDWEQANPTMSTLEVRFLFQYVVSGILGVLRFWLLEFPDMGKDEILSRIDYLMRLSTPPPLPPERADSTDSADSAEPTESADSPDPAESPDSADSTDPAESAEPEA